MDKGAGRLERGIRMTRRVAVAEGGGIMARVGPEIIEVNKHDEIIDTAGMVEHARKRLNHLEKGKPNGRLSKEALPPFLFFCETSCAGLTRNKLSMNRRLGATRSHLALSFCLLYLVNRHGF